MAEMLAAHYPSLPFALVHKIIAFYLENEAAVDQYVAHQNHEIRRQMAASRPATSLAELRKRLDVMRRAETQGTHLTPAQSQAGP